MADDVVIKISGDNSQYKTSLTDAEQSTKQFNDSLQTIGIAAGVAFGALVGGIYKSVEAYAEGEKSAKALNLALQNQGIYSEELVAKYDAIATAIEKKTGIDDDDVKGMFASVQAMIGQKEITKEMADAITDLSAARDIDLKSAGELIAKGINGQTAALKKLGIEVDDHLSKEERTAQILDQVSGKYGGMAESANTGLGSVKGLQTALGGLGEEIGSRFAPLIVGATEALTKFIYWIQENPEIVDFGVKIIAATTAITGLVAGIAAAITIFGQVAAAVGVVTTAIAGMSAGVGLLVGATGLGALLVIGGLIFSDWKEIFPTMEAIFEAFVDNVSALGGAIGTILQGIFSLDTEKISQGYDDAKEVIENGLVEFQMIKNTKMSEAQAKEDKYQGSQIASLKIHADAMQAENDKRDAAELAAVQKKNDDKLAKEEAAHVQFLFQKIKAGGELSQADVDKYGLDEDNIEKHFQEIQGLTDTQDSTLLNKIKSANSTQVSELTSHLGNKKILNDGYNTEELSAVDAQNEKVKTSKKSHFTEIESATSTSMLNIKGLYQEGYSELNQVTKDGEKDIAYKVEVGIASMQTISSAGFLALSRTADAYYADARKKSKDFLDRLSEQAAQYVKNYNLSISQMATPSQDAGKPPKQVDMPQPVLLARGGLAMGGVPGIDSIPALIQQGELVAPVRSFEEVIGSVRAYREAQNMGMSGFGGQSSILIGFDGREASQVLTARQIEDRALGLTQEVTV